RRRRATSATARWPRTDWSRASRYTVVARQRGSAAGWGSIDASQRTKDSFMAELLAPLRRTFPTALRRFPSGTNGLEVQVRPGVLGMDERGSHSGVAGVRWATRRNPLEA